MNNSQIQSAQAWTARWEGKQNHVYIDTNGHPTIGIGFNLDRANAKDTLESINVNYTDVRSGKVDLTDAQVEQLFQQDMQQAINEAQELISNFDQLPPDRQMVVIDLIFNMGSGTFSEFKETINAIEANNWEKAAVEMQDSRWFDQVGDRGIANVDVMGSPYSVNFDILYDTPNYLLNEVENLPMNDLNINDQYNIGEFGDISSHANSPLDTGNYGTNVDTNLIDGSFSSDYSFSSDGAFSNSASDGGDSGSYSNSGDSGSYSNSGGDGGS